MESNQFLKSLSAMDAEEIKVQAKELSDEQHELLLRHIASKTDKNWKNKLLALITGIDECSSLEKIGKLLTADMFFEVVSKKKEVEGNGQEKIPPLVVGMPHETFNHILETASLEELALLQQEGCAQPIQHQLTLFSHEVAFQLESFLEKLRAIEEAIDHLQPTSLTHSDIEAILNGISSAGKVAEETIHRINNALAIGWNTDREDLIEALSFQKECWQKYNTYVVGLPQSGSQRPTGLFARLYDHLNTIFTNPANPKDIEALKDGEPAIEALVKFSMWYLRDYWDVGLLPNIASLTSLDLDPETSSKQQRSEYRASLLALVQKNLEKLGLKTVLDLKQQQIFSRNILKEFVSKNSAKL